MSHRLLLMIVAVLVVREPLWGQIRPVPEWSRGILWHDATHSRLQGNLVLAPFSSLRSLGVSGVILPSVLDATSDEGHDVRSWHHVRSRNLVPLDESELPMRPTTWVWTPADREFVHLVDSAHQAGLRVIMEVQFTHVGREFFAFRELERRQTGSAYRSWFQVSSLRDSAKGSLSHFLYRGMWGRQELPRLNLDSLEQAQGLREYWYAATRRWMDPNGDGRCDDGIDGWKVDLAWELPRAVLLDWVRYVKTVNPDALVVLATADPSRHARDKVADIELTPAFSEATVGFFLQGSANPTYLSRMLMEQDLPGDPNAVDAIWNGFEGGMRALWRDARRGGSKGNRSPSEARGLMKAMLLFQYAVPGAPVVPLPEDVREGDNLELPFVEQEFLLSWMRTLATYRQRFLCLRYGNLRTLLLDDRKRVMGFMRQAGISRVYAYFNADHQPQEVRMTMPGVVEGARVTDLVSGLTFLYQKNGLVLTLPPGTGTLFVALL